MSWKLSVICISLSVMACGAPVLVTLTPETANKAPSINTSTQPATQTSTAVMTVCTDALNIRPEAGDLSRSNGQLEDGNQITVNLPAIVAEDMGLWYELVDGGFANARYLCNYVSPELLKP